MAPHRVNTAGEIDLTFAEADVLRACDFPTAAPGRWGGNAPSTRGPGVASATLDHGAPDVVARGGQGRAHVGGGGQSLGGRPPASVCSTPTNACT
jgi:hypothetical protein